MNEYLKAFQNIALSSETLLTDESNSQEIKQSADRLKASVQPCFEEMNQSAIRLKGLIQKCFNDLYHAEDVWNSKPRIAEALKHEIWEQLGELTGHHFRICRLGSQCKYEAIKQAKISWEQRVERLKINWFIEGKNQQKKGIGWSDKNGFIKDIKSEFDSTYPFPKLKGILIESLKLFNQEYKMLGLESIQPYISLLDKQSKYNCSKQIDTIVSEIETKLDKDNLPNYLHENMKIFKDAVKPALDNLVNMKGDITWEQVLNFKNEVAANIEAIVNLIFDERINLATKAVDEAIAFYNDFLERQERYQQETPKQRQAEKNWIDQQRQELLRLQKGIELIINPFGG